MEVGEKYYSWGSIKDMRQSEIIYINSTTKFIGNQISYSNGSLDYTKKYAWNVLFYSKLVYCKLFMKK